MTTTYTPCFHLSDDTSRTDLQQVLDEQHPTHCQSSTGKIYEIGAGLNQQSIKLSAHPDNEQRTNLRFIQCTSLGHCTEENATASHHERDHALLSASGAHRWLHCTPSAVIEAQHPSTAGGAAAEGTAAHELAEYKLLEALAQPTKRPPASEWHNKDMEEHTDQYATYVLEQIRDAKQRTEDPQVLIEQRVDFSRWVPGGFGTADCMIVDDDTMHVIDFKYGAGVLVDAHDNPQMRLYALGAYDLIGDLYDISTVTMTIYQPRRDNISTDTMSLQALLDWAEHSVAPTAAIAAKGGGDFVPGEWCGFCNIASTCAARAQENMRLAQQEFSDAAELTDAQIADIIKRLPAFEAWATKIKKHALSQAMGGHTYPGLKLVAGRRTRVITDSSKAADILTQHGHTNVFKPKELLALTKLEKLVGKKGFEELLGDLVTQKEAAPKLVGEDAPGTPWEPITAEEEFA